MFRSVTAGDAALRAADADGALAAAIVREAESGAAEPAENCDHVAALRPLVARGSSGALNAALARRVLARTGARTRSSSS